MTLGIHEYGRERAAIVVAEMSGTPSYSDSAPGMVTFHLGFDETGIVADRARPYLPTSAVGEPASD